MDQRNDPATQAHEMGGGSQLGGKHPKLATFTHFSTHGGPRAIHIGGLGLAHPLATPFHPGVWLPMVAERGHGRKPIPKFHHT